MEPIPLKSFWDYSMTKKSAIFFYILVFSLFLAICAPNLFSEGMIMDGLLYASISRNLANGLGTFWNLHCTQTLLPEFHEHPPLAFGLQSLFFRIPGESIYTERIYSLLTCIIVGFLIVLTWKEITGKKSSGWFPLLFWTGIPLVTWSCNSNLLENTMTIFTCLAVLFYMQSLQKNKIIFLFFSGLALAAAFLSKGLTCLYIWSFPFWVWVFPRTISFNRMLRDSFLIVGFTILPIVLMFLVNPDSYVSLEKYFLKQVTRSIADIQTKESRFFIVFRTLKELSILIGFTCLVILIGRRITHSFNFLKGNLKMPLAFFMLSLSGVLPIMISMKQSSFYVLSTLPLFAISFSLIAHPVIVQLINNIKENSNGYKGFRFLTILVFTGTVVFSSFQVNRIKRDKDKVKMIYEFTPLIPKNSTIGIKPELYYDWSLHGYFARYANISLDADTANKHPFYFSPQEIIPNDYEKVAESAGYVLSKKK